MGDYLRSCGVMEVGNGSVCSRAMEMEAESLSSSKRRKVDSQPLINSPESCVSVSSAASLSSISAPATSVCSNDVAKEHSKSLDLNAEAKGFETQFSTFFIRALSRETTPISELCRNSQAMESSTATDKKTSMAAVNSRRKPSAAKMPSAEEIEEFFSVADKYQQKRFAEKYNYDIVKDVPLEGRYQWVRMKP